MINLKATSRCQLFELIAEHTWNEIIISHRNDVHVHEEGHTASIINIIREHSNRIPNFGVWANQGHIEREHGTDIDVFVEHSTGSFVWYAFQSKILYRDNTYHGINTKRNGEYQWDKLSRLSNLSGCISNYLLYNGVTDFHYNGIDICTNEFDEKQFGCSIVSIENIERFSSGRNPTFSDFHPTYAQPWRIIVCCSQTNIKYTYYGIDQIRNSLDYYSQTSGVKDLLPESNILEKRNDFPTNAIDKFSNLEERSPEYRILVRNSASLGGRHNVHRIKY